MPFFSFSEVIYLVATPPGLFGNFLFRLDSYAGFDADRGADFRMPNLDQAFLPFEGEEPLTCADLCGASRSCNGFVTSRHVCYFRQGDVDHLIRSMTKTADVTLYVLQPMLSVRDVLRALFCIIVAIVLLIVCCVFKSELGALRRVCCRNFRALVKKSPAGAAALHAVDTGCLRFLESIFWVKYYFDHYTELALDWLSVHVCSPFVTHCWRPAVINPCRRVDGGCRATVASLAAAVAVAMKAASRAVVSLLLPLLHTLWTALSESPVWLAARLPPSWRRAAAQLKARVAAAAAACWASVPTPVRRALASLAAWCAARWTECKHKLYACIPPSAWSSACVRCLCPCAVRDREAHLAAKADSLGATKPDEPRRFGFNPLLWVKEQLPWPSPQAKAGAPIPLSFSEAVRRNWGGGSEWGGDSTAADYGRERGKKNFLL